MTRSSPSYRRVAITGIGLVCPCGSGTERAWAAVVEGRSGIGPITLFDASALETRFAGEVTDFDPLDYMDRKQARRMDRFQQLAMSAAELALRDAALEPGAADPERTGVIVGTGMGGLVLAEREHRNVLEGGPGAVSPLFILQVLPNMAPAHIAIRYGFKGPNWGTNSACSTSAHALGEALHLVRRGDADVVLAGGAEAPVGLMAIAGFNAIRALSTRNDDPTTASRPFDADRDGFVMSEGAAIVVLEELEHARRRGARIHAELVGYGASADAHHLVVPAPAHEGGQRAMRAALADAGVTPDEVEHVNAHATSTPVGDALEVEALAAVFGPRAARLPVSATKSVTGHMMGAAGAAEAAFTALTLARGVVPPTMNVTRLQEGLEVDCVPGTARPMSVDVALSNSFGFGGTNVSLVLRRGPD